MTVTVFTACATCLKVWKEDEAGFDEAMEMLTASDHVHCPACAGVESVRPECNFQACEWEKL